MGRTLLQELTETEWRERCEWQHPKLTLTARSPQIVMGDTDLQWRDDPGAWHQQLARIVDHRFTTLDQLELFAAEAKLAGVSALMLVQVQKTAACPGNWYNGLQLCDHINGSYPAADGSLDRWQQMLQRIKPMRLMWWTNPAYWSTQGKVWSEASADRHSDVGRWFSWGAENCSGIPMCANPKFPPCPEQNPTVPGQGCAQGSWGSDGACEGVRSALASFGSPGYIEYMVDAYANSWTRNLGIDGYTEDCSGNYPCMLQVPARMRGLPAWGAIMRRVKVLQPHVVHSGEGYGSWEEVIEADADIGGQGVGYYHEAMQQAVATHDMSNIEDVASSSGADGATVLCYLHPAYDGRQPGRCPTLYYRDTTATITDVVAHQTWVMLEAVSGIVPQHDFDPNASWRGASGGAWWNVTNDPAGAEASPLWAFVRERALNRLALRTKLNISGSSEAKPPGQPSPPGLADYEVLRQQTCSSAPGSRAAATPICRKLDEPMLGDGGAAFVDLCAVRCRHTAECGCFVQAFSWWGSTPVPSCQNLAGCEPAGFAADPNSTLYVKRAGPGPLPKHAGGALAYLKHDALGPAGAAALVLFNPGAAQTVTIDLTGLPQSLMGTVPIDLFSRDEAPGPPLSRTWSVEMGARSVAAYGRFGLGSFVPRKGKRAACAADDAYSRRTQGHTLQACFLECLQDPKCENLYFAHVEVPWMSRSPPINCTLLGVISEPSKACKDGNDTLVRKLANGRPQSHT